MRQTLGTPEALCPAEVAEAPPAAALLPLTEFLSRSEERMASRTYCR